MIEVTSQTSHKGQGYEEPYRALAAAIITCAVKDTRNKTAWRRLSALSFFETTWFEFLTEAIEINPEVIRKKLGLMH